MKFRYLTLIFAALLASAVALEKESSDASTGYEKEKNLMLLDMAHYCISKAKDIYFNAPQPPTSGLSANGKRAKSRPYVEKAKQLILELDELYLPSESKADNEKMGSMVVERESSNASTCYKKEKNLMLLDMADYCISKARDIYFNAPKPPTSGLTANGKREKYRPYLEKAKQLILELEELHLPEEPASEYTVFHSPPDPVSCEQKPLDCLDVLSDGQTRSGVYTIWPEGRALDVYCDMDTDGGGWTVIQRRGNFSNQEDFFRGWDDYEEGFGNVTEEFWLGNENIYLLANQSQCEIRFDLTDVKGEQRTAVYQKFCLDDKRKNYTLHIEGYTGNAGDSMAYHNGSKFYTKDSIKSWCAMERKSGWWFDNCTDCNLNGLYCPGKDNKEGMTWYKWHLYTSLAGSEIKLRRKK